MGGVDLTVAVAVRLERREGGVGGGGGGGGGLSECDDSNKTDHKDGQITTILNLE